MRTEPIAGASRTFFNAKYSVRKRKGEDLESTGRKKLTQVTNVAICTVGESQGVTPKEPLMEVSKRVVEFRGSIRLTWKETTPTPTMPSQSWERAFLRRKRPE